MSGTRTVAAVRVRGLASGIAAAALIGCGVGAARPPVVLPPPPSIHAGDVWVATVHGRATALVIAAGRSRLSFRLVPRGSVSRARVTFPQGGRWRYGVLIGRRARFVGAVQVLPRRLVLGEPFDIVPGPGRSYLVADRTGDAVDRLDGTELRKIASAPGARDLEPTPDGKLLVASGRNVLSLDPATRRVETVATVENDVLGVARAVDGAIVVSDFGSRLVRFAGGRTDVLATGLDGVHGLLETGDGLVVCESSTGRLLRLSAGRLQVLAQGLQLPSFAAPGPGGTLYVSEFGADRISRVDSSGTATPVAQVPDPAGISATSDGRLLVASLTGRVARVDPASGRVAWLY